MGESTKPMAEIISEATNNLTIEENKVGGNTVADTLISEICKPLESILKSIEKLYISFENSAVARHSDSPLETTLKKQHEETISATAVPYDPNEGGNTGATIDISPVESSLSLVSLAVTAEKVYINGDVFSSPNERKSKNKDDDDDNDDNDDNDDGKEEKPKKAPSWLKQLLMKMKGKSFSKEEAVLIEKEKEANKKKRAKAWERKTDSWRKSLLKGVNNILFDNPIINFLKNHWFKLLLGALFLFGSKEQMESFVKAIASGMSWIMEEGPKLIKMLLDGITSILDWVIGKKSTPEEINEKAGKVDDLEKRGRAWWFGQSEEEYKAELKEEKNELADMIAGKRSGGLLDSFWKQIGLVVGGLTLLAISLGGGGIVLSALTGLASVSWAGAKLAKNTVSKVAKGATGGIRNFNAEQGMTKAQSIASKARSTAFNTNAALPGPRVGALTPSGVPATSTPISAVSKVSKVMKGVKLAGRIAAPIAVGLTVLDAGMDVNQANKDYNSGKITDKERSNKSIGAITEAGSTLALAAAGASTGAALGAALGSVVPLLGTAVGAAVGGTLGGIAGGITGLMSGDFMNDMGGKFSDKLHETGIISEETRSEKLANIAEDKGAVDIGLGKGEIESERKLKLLDSETLQALLKEETWSNKDQKTIETLLIERETTAKATIIKEEKEKKEVELALKEHKPDSIANTPFKKLSEVLATTRSGPGGEGGKGGPGGVTETTVSQTEKPKDMNSHNGVEGTWSNVGDKWVFYSKNYAGNELEITEEPKKISSSLGGITGGITAQEPRTLKGMEERMMKRNDDKLAASDMGINTHDFTSMNKEEQTKLIEFAETRGVSTEQVKGGYFNYSTTSDNNMGKLGYSGADNREELRTGLGYRDRQNYFKEHGVQAPDMMNPKTNKPFTSLQNVTSLQMERSNKLTPASSPQIRSANMNGIHKQNADLKTSADKTSIVPVSNVTNNNYSGGGGGGTSVITKPTTLPNKEFEKGY